MERGSQRLLCSLCSLVLVFVARCSPPIVSSDKTNDTDANSVSAPGTDKGALDEVKATADDKKGKVKVYIATDDTDKAAGSNQSDKSKDKPEEKTEPVAQDPRHQLIEALSKKDYIGADKILRGMGDLSDELKYLHIYVLDKLGEHERAVKYWQDKVLHFNKSQGVQITDLRFCKRIHDHGRFEVIDGDEFNPGNAILIYVEVKNFQFKDESQGHKLRLEYNWELYDAQNNKLPLWQNVDDNVRRDEILFQNRISEYSQSFLLPLPKNIAGGVYTLKVSVTDLNSSLSHTMEKKLRIKFITE